MNKQKYLFGTDFRLEKVSKLGDPLMKLNSLIDWEAFRAPIEAAIRKKISNRGRPPYDAVLMFKITLLQQWYRLSDMALEYQINDRVSFCRFLGLEFGADVPNRSTIWAFKKNLRTNELDRKLLDLLNEKLAAQGIIPRKGSIIDASFVTSPKRHTT